MQEFVEDRREEGREDNVYVTDYLQTISLVTDQDSKEEGDTPRVSLMTVHAAKGLEFKTVFVVGLEENIFPNAIAAASLRELEEERRLLYVAITRAEEHCILTCAQSRWRYGKMEFDNPSRFIDEIDPSLIENLGERACLRSGDDETEYSFRPTLRPEQPQRRVASVSTSFKPVRGVEAARRIMQISSSASEDIVLQEGTKIEHQRFGIGTVVKIEGSGENCKATVQFANSGTKQLLLKFAKYRVIE